uniref:Uncharacterized protein n=1 Tax=Arundo donax TaxID=35708 RepID=A0A0A9HHW2_ARUDO
MGPGGLELWCWWAAM